MSVTSSDLEKDNFIDCKMHNTSFLHPRKGCHLNIEEENDVLVYLVSFLGSLSVLPGNIISALFMDKIGRIKMIGEFRCKKNMTFTANNAVFFGLWDKMPMILKEIHGVWKEPNWRDGIKERIKEKRKGIIKI